MSSTANLKASGLILSPNQLNLPEGAMTEASNIIIKRDNVVEQRRGFKLYGTSFGDVNSRLKQLFNYKGRLLRHFATTIQYDSDGAGAFADFAGSYSETEVGLRIKSIEANGNFYFTTSAGIKKISVANASDLSTAIITQAGGVKAIDLNARLNITPGNQTGFLPQDSAVAYRVVWGTKDANNNLILGTPSQRVEIYNPIGTLIIQDFMRTLGALDYIDQAGSMIDDGNYIDQLFLLSNSSASDIKTNIIALADKLDNDIQYVGVGSPLTVTGAVIGGGVCTVSFSGSPVLSDYFLVGDSIFLDNFSPAVGTLDGAQVITAIDDTLDTISFSTTATGAVTVVGATINSYNYRFIVEDASITGNPLSTYVIDIPTPDQEYVTLQDRLGRFITRLQEEPQGVIPTGLQTTYISPLDLTTTATVFIDIDIPDDVTDQYFYQIYRSSIVQATGTTVLTDLTPNDEMQLVYEAYPTSAELSAGTITVEDVTPDAFRGANLYTNDATGEGIAQANDVPPFAKDINRFKNSIFYANTKTRYRQNISLLGVTNIPNNSKFVITNGTTTNTYTFVQGVQEVTPITITGLEGAANTLPSSGTSAWFTLNSASDVIQYAFYFQQGTSVAPTSADIPDIASRQVIAIPIIAGDINSLVATKAANTVSIYVSDFVVDISASPNSNQFVVTNASEGVATDATVSSGLTLGSITQGNGEDVAAKKILLSQLVSPAQAVDATARSLIRVLNQNNFEIVYAYYLSTSSTVPGKILLEGRSLNDLPFYMLGDSAALGASFNPDISPSYTTITNTAANPTVITWTGHGLTNGQQVVIVNSNSTPSIDGLWTISNVTTNTFTVPVNVTVAGSTGSASEASAILNSSNEVKPNRVYYSKTSQPEAVPLVNYFDVGAADKSILRIYPLRDSLFVFKEDGLYRISGEGTSSFILSLFDGSCNLIAPDSLALSNNILYGWTNQGIGTVSEAGANSSLSRPIDTVILKIQTSQYTSFKTATWGVGYESDNSYIVWTVKETTDTQATIAYRYSNLTGTWTTFDMSDTCGIVNSADDKLYLGPGDINSQEQERKDFTRYDYSDREISKVIAANNLITNTIRFPTVSDLSIGDVIVQDQTLTVMNYNELLQKLDLDPGTSFKNYFSTLSAIAGENLRNKLVALATKLDLDTGVSDSTYAASIAAITVGITSSSVANPTVITTAAPHGLVTGRVISITGHTGSSPAISGQYTVTVTGASTFTIPVNVITGGTGGSLTTLNDNFNDIKASFNTIISKLNNDAGVAFSNYMLITENTIQEAVITAINYNIKIVTVNLALDFIVGDVTVFKAIESTFTYAPLTMGDPISFKQMREATLMFDAKTFTQATLSFATDLLPEFKDVRFNGDGNGIFGHSIFGSGFFGGGSHAAPFRTYVPRDCQRCRFLLIKFTHQVAREGYSIFGTTVSGNEYSIRAYR